MSESLATYKEYFDKISPLYDEGREHFFHNDLKRFERDIALFISPVLDARARILDLGCGTGFYTMGLAQNGFRRFFCLDLNDTFLEHVRDKLIAHSAEVEVECQKADLETFVRRRSVGPALNVDFIVIGSVLQYIGNYETLLEQLSELAPGAGFYITSHKLSVKRRLPLLEDSLARLDYIIHRLIRGNWRKKRALGTVVTGTVSEEVLLDLFRRNGFKVVFLTYTTFHTHFFTALHKFLAGRISGLGSYFTLIALRSEDGANGATSDRGVDPVDNSSR